MADIQTTPAKAAEQKQSVFYLSYFDGIDMARVKAIMGVCANIVANQKPDELYFLFSSPGGEVNAGIVLYNFLKAIPVKITMHNTGIVDSIGNIIFVAGDQRYAAPYSSFLFHGISMGFPQNAQLNLSQLNERKSSLENDEKKIAGILNSNTKLTEDEILRFFREGESKDAEFALSKGVVSKIVAPLIPKDAPHITINFQ